MRTNSNQKWKNKKKLAPLNAVDHICKQSTARTCEMQQGTPTPPDS